MAYNKRVLKEIKAGYESNAFDFFQDTDGYYGDKGACYLRFTITDGTYVGETHVLQMKFIYGNGEYQYPRNPANVLFMTPIFHTNIATGGSICLDVIKEKWSPLYGIEIIFNSIVALLEVPNTDSPFNTVASDSYKEYMKKDDLAGYSRVCHDYYETRVKNPKTIAYRLLNAPEFEK